jgi:hypothetical protein
MGDTHDTALSVRDVPVAGLVVAEVVQADPCHSAANVDVLDPSV